MDAWARFCESMGTRCEHLEKGVQCDEGRAQGSRFCPAHLPWMEQLEIGGSMERLAAAAGNRPILRPALAELGKIKRSAKYGRPVRILPPATRGGRG